MYIGIEKSCMYNIHIMKYMSYFVKKKMESLQIRKITCDLCFACLFFALFRLKICMCCCVVISNCIIPRHV